MNTDFPTLQKRLARNVKCVRLAAGLSQEKLALEAEIDRTYISQIERGISNPSLLVLCKIANRLGVDVVELLHTSTTQ
jgi:transcriptional regulator with XRE-family HTH domain